MSAGLLVDAPLCTDLQRPTSRVRTASGFCLHLVDTHAPALLCPSSVAAFTSFRPCRLPPFPSLPPSPSSRIFHRATGPPPLGSTALLCSSSHHAGSTQVSALDSEPLHSLNGLAVLELAQCGLDADQRIRLPTPPTRGPLQCSSVVPGNYFLQRPVLCHCFKPSAFHCFRE